MSDKERHDMFERFIYMYQSTLIPHGRTSEEWDSMKLRAEKKAHELARPILLEMICAYAEQEIAGIGCVCGHDESAEYYSQSDQEALAHWQKAFGAYAQACTERTGDQEQEALEESCDAYNANQDSQFMKHVHAMKCALFIDVRDAYVKILVGYDDYAILARQSAWAALRRMSPDAGLSHMIQVAESLLVHWRENPPLVTASVLGEALARMFKEVHDG